MKKKIRLIQVVGARPQIIKSSAIERAVKSYFQHHIELQTLHTGQHYDEEMSDQFYVELGLDLPAFSLAIGSGSHADQTARMMEACEQVFQMEKPDAVIVYGDTNSTLAAAITANKLDVPLIHIEAGLRSHNLHMPEECNRIATDHLSDFLFCPTSRAMEELHQEGICPYSPKQDDKEPKLFRSGDIMYDNSLHYSQKEVWMKHVNPNLLPGSGFILATCHRPHNTDKEEALLQILDALALLAEEQPVLSLCTLDYRPKHISLKDIKTEASNLSTL